MECVNHSNAEAQDRCTGCAEPFCHECLVEVVGEKYCGSCKVLAVKAKPVLETGMEPCDEANQALILALVSATVGLCLCIGVFLGPITIVRGAQAWKRISEEPRLLGAGKATAAIIIGVVIFGLACIQLIAAAAHRGN
jgi:hypothetical protein